MVAKLVLGPGDQRGRGDRPAHRRRGRGQADEHVEDAMRPRRHRPRRRHPPDRRRVRGGSFYAPTLLDGINEDMLMSCEETFGPVCGVTRVRHGGRGHRPGQRQRLRPLRLLPHARLRAPDPCRREARLRNRGRERGHHQRGECAVRRREGIRLRPRGRLGRDRRVPGRQVRPRCRRRYVAGVTQRARLKGPDSSGPLAYWPLLAEELKQG